jgi:archaeal type IV pilus assembly protein PilA
LFKNNDAVSPVIGVILMVAITVILAAAIGSTVFGAGPKASAPQANIVIAANSFAGTDSAGSVKVEHLGGDTVHFGTDITRVTASLNGAPSVDINATVLGNMSVGDSNILPLADASGNNPFAGHPVTSDTVNIKIIDVRTSQLISNRDVRF